MTTSDPVVVVQGTAVSGPYGADGSYDESNMHQQPEAPVTVTRGEKQESKCRDPIFALLLYICVIGIAAVAGNYGKAVLSNTDVDAMDYHGYLYAVVVSGIIAIIVSGFGMAFIFKFPSFCIKTSLLFSVVMAGVICVFGFMSGQLFAGILGLVFFMISICYAWCVWSRIPFATVNLVTAITAVKSNLGVTFVALFFTLLAGVWTFVWTVAFVGVWDQTYSCNENGVCSDPNYGILFVLFLPYFFAQQVFQACIHVTVAGVVGTWWFTPDEANSCCSPGIRDSFVRTVTTSFGSICFGSLLVAILQTLKMIAQQARENGDAAILACIAECILDCLASLLEYFNKWAYIYVGLYGYSYMEAGKNVITLFKNRGWEAIIADDLISNVLTLVSLVVGLITGGLGILMSESTDWFDSAHIPGDPRLVSFILAFIVGLVLCSILMSLVGSAVNAIIVLFAEAPAEFQDHYPDLSDKMRAQWAANFPGTI